MFDIDISFGDSMSKPKTKKQLEKEALLEVYVLDYGNDDYHRFSDEPTSEEERAVRKLRNRYKNVPDFVEARRIYDTYMESLYEYYGGKDMFKKYKKLGMIYHYIPNKPKLKNNKELKLLYKHCPTIRPMGKNVIDKDYLDKYLDDVYPELHLSDKTESDDYEYWHDDERPVIENTVKIPIQKGDKRAEKLIDKGENEDNSKKPHGYTKAKGYSYEVDFLQASFSLKNPKKYKKKKKIKTVKENPDKILLEDLLYARPGDIYFVEEEDEQTYAPYTNLFKTSSYKDELDMFTKLSELGWDAYGIMKKSGYNKRTLANFNPKKIKKKNKKAEKKAKKRREREARDNEMLREIMFDAGYDDFDEYSKELLNMTSANIFK